MALTIDHDAVAAHLRGAAGEAIMPYFQRLRRQDVREKGRGDYVTVADEGAERHLAASLPELIPGSVAVGEEAVSRDPAALDCLAEAAPVWLIDPVDGTRLFERGEAGFTVMLALMRAGEVLAGWIYDPLTDSLAAGELGAGTAIDGKPVRLPRPGGLDSMHGHISLPAATKAWRDAVRRRARQKLARELRGLPAGLCYWRLLTGTYDFTFFQNLKPWDHAPGLLLHAEAGGYAAQLTGAAYVPTRISQQAADGCLAAADRQTWQTVVAEILSPAPEQSSAS